MSQSKLPHARITVEEVKAQYKVGLLTVSGYLYNFLLASKREGWKMRSSVTKLCTDLEISRPSFYRAIAILRDHRLIGFEIFGEVENWVEDRPCLEVGTKEDPSQILDRRSSKPNSDRDSFICEVCDLTPETFNQHQA